MSLFLPETWGRLQNSCHFGHKRISKPREVISLGSPSEEEFYDKQISCIPSACCIHFLSLFGSLCGLRCWTKPVPPPAPHIWPLSTRALLSGPHQAVATHSVGSASARTRGEEAVPSRLSLEKCLVLAWSGGHHPVKPGGARPALSPAPGSCPGVGRGLCSEPVKGG